MMEAACQTTACQTTACQTTRITALQVLTQELSRPAGQQGPPTSCLQVTLVCSLGLPGDALAAAGKLGLGPATRAAGSCAPSSDAGSPRPAGLTWPLPCMALSVGPGCCLCSCQEPSASCAFWPGCCLPGPPRLHALLWHPRRGGAWSAGPAGPSASWARVQPGTAWLCACGPCAAAASGGCAGRLCPGTAGCCARAGWARRSLPHTKQPALLRCDPRRGSSTQLAMLALPRVQLLEASCSSSRRPCRCAGLSNRCRPTSSAGPSSAWCPLAQATWLRANQGPAVPWRCRSRGGLVPDRPAGMRAPPAWLQEMGPARGPRRSPEQLQWPRPPGQLCQAWLPHTRHADCAPLLGGPGRRGRSGCRPSQR